MALHGDGFDYVIDVRGFDSFVLFDRVIANSDRIIGRIYLYSHDFKIETLMIASFSSSHYCCLDYVCRISLTKFQ